jgi:ketosteroid isomerase-like protein
MSALPAKADSWPTHLGYSAATSKRAEPAGVIVPKSSSHKASIEVKNIKAANDAYYRALSARDMHAMEKVWTGAADNMLIAPPANPRVHVGWVAIKRNWEAYWPVFVKYRVTMRVNKVNVSGPVAWVHGIETSHRRTKSGEVSSSHNYGTNIFVHRHDRWLMVFHQVVAIPEKHASKRVV